MNAPRMTAEMAEQPERLRDLIARTDEVEATVQDVAPRPLRGVTLVARGSCDHAAVYGRYLLEQATGNAISLAAPSLHTLYGVRGDYAVIAISAPGPAAENVLELVAELRRRGARPLLISPDEESDIPLPRGMPETLAPIVAVVRGQQVARALALALELDPDSPPGLSKVTVT